MALEHSLWKVFKEVKYHRTSSTRNDPIVGFKFLLVQEVQAKGTDPTNSNQLDGFAFSEHVPATGGKSVFDGDPASPILRSQVIAFTSKVQFCNIGRNSSWQETW